MQEIPEHNFVDLGFNDILQGTELFTTLQVDPFRVMNPVQNSQLRDIAKFINEFPEALSLIRMSMFKKPADLDALTYISRFSALHRQRYQLQESLKDPELINRPPIQEELTLTEKEISFYE